MSPINCIITPFGKIDTAYDDYICALRGIITAESFCAAAPRAAQSGGAPQFIYKSERKKAMAVYKSENGGTVEMPVEMALMIAGDSGACEAFASLSEERKCEYIRRAKSAGTSLRMKEIIRDIKTIG